MVARLDSTFYVALPYLRGEDAKMRNNSPLQSQIGAAQKTYNYQSIHQVRERASRHTSRLLGSVTLGICITL